jgi:protein-S-isoprenylcysteine O-methyltransferase Ste14
MKALDTKIPPPLAALLVAVAMWGISRVTPALFIDRTWRLVIAATVASLGALVAVLAATAFRRAQTTHNPMTPEAASSIVSNGVFSYTRNPMYVGLTTLLVAWAVYLASLAALLGPVVLVLFITRFQILPEERALAAKFGRDYDDYRRRVRRWL